MSSFFTNLEPYEYVYAALFGLFGLMWAVKIVQTMRNKWAQLFVILLLTAGPFFLMLLAATKVREKNPNNREVFAIIMYIVAVIIIALSWVLLYLRK